MKHLFRTKAHAQIIDDAHSGDHQMHRALGPWHLIFLGIGCVIGAGIFVLTGVASAQYAGPAISLSFVLSGFACAFAGLCYAEFASMMPVSGSAYTYAYATLGELFAWVIGWDLILEYMFGSSSVAVGWSGYVVSFCRDFGLNIPAALCNAPLSYDPRAGLSLTGAWLNLPAVCVIAMMTTLLVIGIRESANFNNAIVIVKVIVILLFIGFVAAVISGLFPIGFLGEMVSIGALLAFTMVSAGVLVMRYTKPDVPRHFRVPWVPLVPLLGMLFSLAQMLAMPRDTWIRLVVWMLIGFAVYFMYSRRNIRLRQGLPSSRG